MFNWVLDLFRVREPLPPRTPRIGEHWRIRSDDPWGSTYPPVVIMDVRAGWVRYYMNRAFCDRRMRIDEFTQVYQLEDLK